MSDINRIQGNFRGLIVQNKNNNILTMDQSGNYSLHTQTIENVSYNKLINISENESIYTAKNNNLVLSSEDGTVIIRNGKENNEKKYDFSNPSYSVSDDIFFDTNNTSQISHPFSSTEEVNNLTNNSFLLESLGSKSMCLYSNNGLHQISHGNMNLIGDAEILLQASQKLNLTSLGYITLNSERLLGAIEEDVTILSSTGEFKMAGDGIQTVGLKINSNMERNFTSLGRFSEKANRSLHIDIQNVSYDNTKKNGLLIESKKISQDSFPDIQLTNYDKTNVDNNNNILTSLNVGIGSDNQDINNLIFVKKQTVDGKTQLVSLNNFKFTNTDVNKTITYVDTTLTPDIIKTYVSESIVNISSVNTAIEITNFGFQQAYINRDNHGHLKTKTNSNLHLGTNKNDILVIKNTGNIGINTNNPESTLEISNNYGNINNIRLEKNIIYQSAQVIQTNSGNYIVFYNTLKNNLYNLMASIYTVNNDLVSQFTIYEKSYVFINFSVDKLKDIEDKFVIAYSYFNNLVYITETKVFNGVGVFQNINYKFTHDSLLATSNPKVKSFQLLVNSATGENYNGYIMVYREKKETNTELRVDYLSNNSANLVGSLEITNELNLYLQTTISDYESTQSKNIKFHDLEYDQTNQKIIVSVSGEFDITLTNSEIKKYYLSLVIEINLNYNSSSQKPNVIINSSFKTLSNSLTEEYLGFSINLKNATSQLYVYSYYLSNLSKITKVGRGEYNSNTGKFINPNNIVDSLTDTITTSPYRYNNYPNIDIISSTHFLISYQKGDLISYYNSDTDASIELSEFSKANTPFIHSLHDSANNYQTSIIFFNNEDTGNPYYNQSINFKEILGVSNMISIKNNNNNIQIKNTGDITITDIVNISKTKKTTEFEKLIIKTSTEVVSADNPGINGELRIYQNELFIFINNGWKKISLANI